MLYLRFLCNKNLNNVFIVYANELKLMIRILYYNVHEFTHAVKKSQYNTVYRYHSKLHSLT